MSAAIFISYSHQDASLVKPVVGLLRGTKDLVFQDVDKIKPGRRWREQMEEALRAAHLVVLFWCYHSSQSLEVREEYSSALMEGKDILPVLLDGTPLPERLNEFQWVDFRQLVGSSHQRDDLPAKIYLRPPFYKRHPIRTTISVLILEVLFLFMFWEFPWLLYPLLVIVFLPVGLLIAEKIWRQIYYQQQRNFQRRMAERLEREFFRRGLGTA